MDAKKLLEKSTLSFSYIKFSFVVGLLMIFSVATNIWAPLWVFPVLIWLFGLYIAYVQISYESTTKISERANILEKTHKVTEKLVWEANNIFTFHLKQLPFGFKRPFDDRVFSSLTKSAADALTRFGAATVYVYGQHAVFLFPSAARRPAHFARVDSKIEAASAMASFLTLRFKTHLVDFAYTEDEAALLETLEKKTPFYFEGNVFSTESELEAMNFFLNASLMRCRSYGIAQLCSLHFVPSEISGLTVQQMTKKLLMERKIDWFEQPKSVQLGAFVKFVKEEGGEKEAEPYVETGDENHPFDAKAAEIKRMFISNRTVHFDETGRQFLFDPVWDCNNE